MVPKGWKKGCLFFFLFLLIILLISLPSERYNLKISTLMWVFWENHRFLTGKEFSLICSLGNFCPCHVYHPCSGFNSLMPTLIYLVSAQPEYSLLGGLMFWISWMMDIFKASIVKNLHLDQSYTSRHTSGLSDSDCCFFSQHLTIIQLLTSYYSYTVQWLRVEGFPLLQIFFFTALDP